MKAKSYAKITNACLVVAIFSALLFDRFAAAKTFVGAIGILAGVVAVGVYFYNQRVVEEQSTPADPALVAQEQHGQQALRALPEARRAKATDIPWGSTSWDYSVGRAHGRASLEDTLETLWLRHTPTEVEYEIRFNADGRVLIRPVHSRRLSHRSQAEKAQQQLSSSVTLDDQMLRWFSSWKDAFA